MLREHEGKKQEVLVVDDDRYLLLALQQTLELNGYTSDIFTSPVAALAAIDSKPFVAVLSDIRMNELDGLALLEKIVLQKPDLPVVLLTGHGDVTLAVRAMRLGAYDFLQKPVDDEILLGALGRAVERRNLMMENRRLAQLVQDGRESRSFFYGLVGTHPSMRSLYSLIEILGKEDDPVLVCGETGTGKELVARALHIIRHAENAAPLVAVNMGAIPGEIIESELFGYEKGAFSGANSKKIGKFEFAGKGTLFLDEICSMPLALQGKLLRVLEERAFTRVGGNTVVPLQARIVAATNRDLECEVREGRFRQDLFFRLNVLPIQITPLRERKEDIPLLAQYFLDEYNVLQEDGVAVLPAALVQQFTEKEWPGNIRELRNVIRRHCIMAHRVQENPEKKRRQEVQEQPLPSWKEHMLNAEKKYLLRVLEKSEGQIQEVCECMGISRKSVYEKINKHRINLERIREASKKRPTT